MKRIPSVDTIETRTHVDRETAIKIRRVLDGRDDPEQYESVARMVDECFHLPRRTELVLAACDELLQTHGTEAINAEDAWTPYWQECVAVYCNTGDSHGATILYDVERNVFYVTTWADWVETAERSRRYKFR